MLEVARKLSSKYKRFSDRGLAFATGLTREDERWREPLLDALAPKPGERILDASIASVALAADLASRFPETVVVGADLRDGVLSSSARASFDKVVCCMTLHTLADKTSFLRPLYRALRHNGSLYVADLDRPTDLNEQIALNVARIAYGPGVEPHFDGSWTTALDEAGFTSVRRLSSHTFGMGRVSVVRGRKR
ncbi:class I SAM-dependent methyltransferase [Microvirga sp. Mcv34]|uniref:class I SAM-dependent methyltransferase n=1 Tax=Microvirga sp. Mcv34 TaxID=2926016 RepID=UPI0021C8AC96|nr:methyltransferase domain-containing protein [Microvirga sp. Mcv34]